MPGIFAHIARLGGAPGGRPRSMVFPRLGESFHLSRHFSAVSLVLIVAAGVALGLFYRELSLQQLVEMAEDRNEAMAEVFRNSLWPDYARFVARSPGLSPEELRSAREAEIFRKAVVALMQNTDAIKVKVYNRQGLTVLSTDPAQIGEVKEGNGGFQRALAGQVASALVHRDAFDSFEGVPADRDLISSYVPIRDGRDRIEGVFELYQDVTPFLAYANRRLAWVGAGVLAIFGLLYLLQFLVVRRAHGILRHQGRQLNQYLGIIEETNSTLEMRVGERTRELEQANERLAAEVAERRLAQQRLDFLAYHDPLTGLPNRLRFNQRLGESLERAAGAGAMVALVYIDLDNFKNVNDSLGHFVGDAVLIEVARRLSSINETEAMLARLGGDEFVCLMEDLAHPGAARALADRLLALFAAPFAAADHEFFLSASVGVSLYPEDGDDAITLQRNADTAMYQAKANGRNRQQFYTREMTTSAQERVRLETLLRRSIEHAELSIHYQPQVDISTGRLTGAEALVRWHSSEAGTVPPSRFIGVAEDTGFIVPLGEWTLRESCRQFMAWRRQGFHLPKIAVNLSVKQLERPDAIDTIRNILAETRMEPEWLELEITESVIMEMEDSLKLLDQLRCLGIKLSVDDFGTGYSSLNYLKILPIQKLKIDRSFVVGIGSNIGDEAIIRTILALARSLHLEVVAEGVETEAQQDFLRGEGCRQIQGYLHGRPTAAEDFFQSWGPAANDRDLRPGQALLH